MNKLLLASVVALSVGGCAMSQRETNGALIGGDRRRADRRRRHAFVGRGGGRRRGRRGGGRDDRQRHGPASALLAQQLRQLGLPLTLSVGRQYSRNDKGKRTAATPAGEP